MRQVIAILGDSLREAWDRRALFILLVLCLLPILFCFSLAFADKALPEVLAAQAAELFEFRKHRGGSHHSELHPVVIEVGAVTAVGDDEFGAGLRSGHVVDLRFATAADLDGLAVAWFRFQGQQGFADADAPPPATVAGMPRERAFLEQRFAEFGWEHVVAAPVGEQSWRVAVRSDYPNEIGGATVIRAGFGAFTLPISGVSRAEFVVMLQQMLTDVFVGFIGMLVALSACSGFVPNLLQKGTLDLVLARPIGRGKLLLAKYVGGLWFVLCLAAFLVTGCWLGLAVTSGYSNPWFLGTIVTLSGCFAVLYSVSVLAGVYTRSAGMSALAALAIWFVSSIVANLRQVIRSGLWDVDGWIRTVIDGAYMVLPKIKDVGLLNTVLLGRAHLSEPARARLFRDEMLPEVDWSVSLGTTAAFAVVMLALAVRAFRRRDC